jgi:hypothetical protein
MTDNSVLPFAFPSVCGKSITAAFDGGRLTSDKLCDGRGRIIPRIRSQNLAPLFQFVAHKFGIAAAPQPCGEQRKLPSATKVCFRTPLVNHYESLPRQQSPGNRPRPIGTDTARPTVTPDILAVRRQLPPGRWR